MTVSARFVYLVAPLILVGAGALAACGSGDNGGFTPPPADPGDAGNADVGNLLGPGVNVASITVDPPTATIESLNSAAVTQAFTATAHMTDGTSQKLTANVTWSATNLQLGGVNGSGLYTASGSIGGLATITASAKGMSGTAQLAVKLHITENPGNILPVVQGNLKGATTADAGIKWAYPYDGTVFPRGLGAPTLMWNGGAATDAYYVHVTSKYFEYESFATAPSAPASRITLVDANWQKLVDSTSGDAGVFVSRWDGAAATVIANHQTWTIAPQSMRGTIYYWANNLGRVMRIKPGATAPDDFANKAPLNDPAQFTQSSCLMTCHTVSADGSTIISGGGTYGGSYDLIAGAPKKSLGGTWGPVSDGQVIQWMDPALSPDGKIMVVNSMALGLNAASGTPTTGGFNGVYDAATGAKLTSGALDGLLPAMPTFAPDGSLVAYVDSGDPSTWSGGWNNPNPGNLRLVSFNAKATPMATNARDLVAAGADPAKRIGWPTIAPDAKWVLYQRGASADTRGGSADMYIASTLAANQEIRLAKLDGDGYPFAAGARDLGLNYEPTFAPVAAGGYFWVVFTSRRTYGNVLTDQAYPDASHSGTKQLWVAAIDQNPVAGKDPSHPPFRLPGQDVASVNMRGFWALDPCKGDGAGCASGTECCGGYCDAAGDGGAPVCKSQHTSCSLNGDRCDQSSDCCNASAGVTCINHVCSEPPPK